jgi:integrase
MSSGVVRARGGRHQVDIYLQGERYRKAVGSKREATRFLEQMRAGGRHPQRKLAVEEVLALYEQTLRVRAKWNTIGQLEVHARHLLHHFGEGFLATAIAPQDIEKFASARKAEGRSHSTVNGSLRILRAALRNAVEQRELAEMPCRIKLLRETKKLPMILNAEEVEQLLAVAPAPIDLAILIAAKAGLRHQEIRFLQVRDADLARSILLVRAKHGSIWSEEPKRFTKAIFSDSGGPKIARQVIAC